MIAASGSVLMTADEARDCIARIRTNLDDVRTTVLDLREREGYLALGYPSWRACVKVEFSESIATIYRQLRAAEVDRDVSQVETTPVRLPTVQAQELARLPDAESRQEAYLLAKEETNGKLTQDAVKVAVDRVQADQCPAPAPTVEPTEVLAPEPALFVEPPANRGEELLLIADLAAFLRDEYLTRIATSDGVTTRHDRHCDYGKPGRASCYRRCVAAQALLQRAELI